MKKVEKKAKKKKDKEYVYHVTDLMYWQVLIFRYRVVKRTTKRVTVLDATKREISFPLSEEDGKICDTKEEALAFAKEYLKKRKTMMKKYRAMLDASEKDIDKGKVRIVKAIPLPTNLTSIKL